MQSIRKLLLAGAAVALSGAAIPAAAQPAVSYQVAQAGACHVRLTGSVTQVLGPNAFTMRVDNRRVGSIHVYDANASINARRHSIAPGTYVAADGCFSSDMRSFNANVVTLAASQRDYDNFSESATVPNDNVGPCHVSLFGTVTQVWPNGYEFTLQTNGDIGSIHVYDKGALMHANGVSVQNGVFAHAYGCFIHNQAFFHANEVTLAASAAAFGDDYHPAITVHGVVDEIGRGWIGMRTRYYGHVHVLTNQTNVHRGENVIVTGTYNTRLREIVATSVR